MTTVRRPRVGIGRVMLVSIAAIAVVATACSSSSGKSGSPSSPPSGTQLTISYSQKTGDEIGLWIAKEAGYFTDNGLDVTLKYLKSNAGIPALISGQIPIASIGGSDALAAIAQGADLKYVLTLAPVFTFQFWALPKYADDASKLKGQRVGITSTSGSQYAGTVLALQSLGLSTSDVQITALGSVPNVDSALLSGSIAAAASHPPATFEFKKHGYVNIADLAAKKVANANTGFAIPADYIESHADVVQKVVDATVKAVQREKSDKAYTEQVMKKYMGITDKAQLDFTYDFYANDVAVSVPLPEVAQFQASQQALGVKNPKVKDVDLASFIDQSFVKKAADKLGIK